MILAALKNCYSLGSIFDPVLCDSAKVLCLDVSSGHLRRYWPSFDQYQIAYEHSNQAHGLKKAISFFCNTLKLTLGSQGVEGRIEKAYNARIAWQKQLDQHVISFELDDPDTFDYELEDAGIVLPNNPHFCTPWACVVVSRHLIILIDATADPIPLGIRLLFYLVPKKAFM